MFRLNLDPYCRKILINTQNLKTWIWIRLKLRLLLPGNHALPGTLDRDVVAGPELVAAAPGHRQVGILHHPAHKIFGASRTSKSGPTEVIILDYYIFYIYIIYI